MDRDRGERMKLRGASRTVAAIALSVAVLCAAGACAGQSIPGHPRPSADVSPVAVAGLPVTEGPSGLRPGVSTAKVPVRGYTGTDMDKLAVDAVADIETFWSRTLRQDFGKRFRAPRTVVSFDSRTAAGQVCGASPHGMRTVEYCAATDTLAWDRGALLPALNAKFGPMAVVTVLAHEVGQVVQHRLARGDVPLVAAQQADCYAGSFIRWVADGKAKHLRVSTGDGLNEVLSTLMFVRDDSATDPATLGSPFDRVTAFQLGFTNGATRCAKIDASEVQQRVTELGFTPASETNDNLPVDETSIGLLAQSLNAAFKQTAPTPPAIIAGTGTCQDGTGTPPASFCPVDNTIDIDETALNAIAALPAGTGLAPADAEPTTTPAAGPTGSGLGDFAAFAEVASRYALAVQKSLGIPLDDTNAGLRTACLTGAWAGVIRHHVSAGPTPQLLLGPGDLDEAVAELLSPTSMIAADINGIKVPAGFARINSFQDGFLQGSSVCTSQFS